MIIVSETLRNTNLKVFYNLTVDSEVGYHVLKVEYHKLDVIQKDFSFIMRVQFSVMYSPHLYQSIIKKIYMNWRMF